MFKDISPNFRGYNPQHAAIIDDILRYEETPRAITRFAELERGLDDYWYWFVLSTLWVSYSGWSDLQLWKRLFRGSRPKRATSIMKPSEWAAYRALPARITAYRAHRPGETDWISYTIDRELAERWVKQRGGHLATYELRKVDCLALFLRRGESEILMLEPKKARRLGEHM